jgi:hypothetical protein
LVCSEWATFDRLLPVMNYVADDYSIIGKESNQEKNVGGMAMA